MQEKIKLRFFAEKPSLLPKNVGMKMGVLLREQC